MQYKQKVTDANSVLECVQYDTIAIQSVATDNNKTEAFARVALRATGKKIRHYIQLKVDTGAQGNTLPLRIYKKMFPDQLNKRGEPTNIQPKQKGTQLTAYNGTPIQCYGHINLVCRFKDGAWHTGKFYIVNVAGPAIIGFPFSKKLNLVTML